MATLASVIVDIRAAVEGLAGTPLTYAGGDYRDDLASVAPQADVYQLRYQHQQEIIRSNVSYQTAAVEVVMIHHLLNPTAASERQFTIGQMLLDQADLLDRNFWTGASAGIYQLQEDGRPEIEENVERLGNVMVYSVVCAIEIVP